MTIFGDAIGAIRRVILLDDKVARIDDRLTELARLHADTRERVMRMEGFIDAARMRRLDDKS